MVHLEVSDYIAAGSLLVAFVALVKSFLSDRRLKNLDVQIKEKELLHHVSDEEEAKKADIEVEIIEPANKKMGCLRFYNKGKADAVNVEFSIPTDDVENKIILHMQPDYLPYPKLISYQRFEVPYLNNSGKPHQTIVITWDDEFGKGRRKEMVVDM